MQKSARIIFFVIAGLMSQQASSAPSSAAPAGDYFKDRFEIERVLDWGDRPVWSADSKRIAFTRDYKSFGPAYEMDVATRQVRCLTCRFGASGFLQRIYYLPDNSYLIVAAPSIGTAEVTRDGKSTQVDGNALYWMPADASLPPQPLAAAALGEVAIDYDHSTPGEIRIAWGEYNGKARMLMGNIVHNGKQAFLVNRTVLYTDALKDPKSLVTLMETYDFIDDDKSVAFSTLEAGKDPRAAMYKLDIATGAVTAMPHDGQHNETHSFPDVRYGLEESNRASDPSGPYRGISANRPWAFAWAFKLMGRPDGEALGQRYGGKTFDLYALDWQTGKRRRLTNVSDLGGQAHQSSPARNGRQVVFTMEAPKSGPYAGKGGLYIGTFRN